jgi:isopenicillin-N epimerase
MPSSPAALSPPRFGHAMLAEFPLERGAVYLNHGTVGVTPLAVMRARSALLDEIERHPARFMIRELTSLGMSAPPEAPRLRSAASEVARFLGADEGLAFIDNATSGINAVLRSFPLAPGDEILIHDHAYGGVARALAFIARERGVTVARLALPFPAHDPADFVRAVERAITPCTRLALLDHVTSETALVLPLAEMAAACRARGVAVLVDGAHAPGAIEVDIAGLGVDWYVANLHKWAFAPRSCGVLWAAPERRAGLHPCVLSWDVTSGDWLQEFDWTGTRDPSPWLAAPAALAFMRDRLGTEAMRRHNHALAWESARMLAERWRRDWPTPEPMVGCMVTVALPEWLGPVDAISAQRLRDALLERHVIEVPVIARAGALWLRVSLQVYNEAADVERLAEAVESLR